MNRLPDLINIAKWNIFANSVCFNNCFGKSSISILLSFTITVWVLSIVLQMSKMCACVQGLQINEINVNLLQNTLNLADIKQCIAYMHTKNPLSYLFRKWNMLHWIKGRHCEFYITYITQALLISDNKCSFFASQQTMKKFFWSQSFLYPSIQYNHWFRRKHK